MELIIIPVYENLDEYIFEIEKENADCDILWDKYAIQPYWEKISHWAPYDMSNRKPTPIKGIHKLKEQIKLMKEINLNEIRNKLMQVVQVLPNYDDAPIVIAIYPLDDKYTITKERQNGVQGTCVFGNIVLQINPFAQDYFEWIPYVFTHEYHHCVWGNYWIVTHGGHTGKFIESMLSDGEADAFAKSLYPTLTPQWLSQIPKEQEMELWNKHYSKLLYETNYDYCKYMFGDKKAGMPWCAGYFFGYRIIECFRKNHPLVSVKEILEMNSEDIYAMSNYHFYKV